MFLSIMINDNFVLFISDIYMCRLLILGFHQSCDRNKNHNHSMKNVKSLRYDRWLIFKQPCQ